MPGASIASTSIDYIKNPGGAETGFLCGLPVIQQAEII
jgi:hypothetical protein